MVPIEEYDNLKYDFDTIFQTSLNSLSDEQINKLLYWNNLLQKHAMTYEQFKGCQVCSSQTIINRMHSWLHENQYKNAHEKTSRISNFIGGKSK